MLVPHREDDPGSSRRPHPQRTLHKDRTGGDLFLVTHLTVEVSVFIYRHRHRRAPLGPARARRRRGTAAGRGGAAGEGEKKERKQTGQGRDGRTAQTATSQTGSVVRPCARALSHEPCSPPPGCLRASAFPFFLFSPSLAAPVPGMNNTKSWSTWSAVRIVFYCPRICARHPSPSELTEQPDLIFHEIQGGAREAPHATTTH